MRYAAECFHTAPAYRVTDAVLADGRVSIDWEWDGGPVHLEAESADGVTFRGHYGYPDLDPARRVEFTLYRSAAGGAVLVGQWYNMVDGGVEEWLFRLAPPAAPGCGLAPDAEPIAAADGSGRVAFRESLSLSGPGF